MWHTETRQAGILFILLIATVTQYIQRTRLCPFPLVEAGRVKHGVASIKPLPSIIHKRQQKYTLTLKHILFVSRLGFAANQTGRHVMCIWHTFPFIQSRRLNHQTSEMKPAIWNKTAIYGNETNLHCWTLNVAARGTCWNLLRIWAATDRVDKIGLGSSSTRSRINFFLHKLRASDQTCFL